MPKPIITVPLTKSAFLNEAQAKLALAKFVKTAPQLSMGRQCLGFEQAFARWQGRRHAVLFNSGGSANFALLQALKNLGWLAAGDPVAFSALTWSTNVMPLIQTGLRPVAVDCTPSTLNVMSAQLAAAWRRRPVRAFFITNALGFTGDLPATRQFCQRHKILLLEDNCESLGTVLPAGKAGNFGLAATFSFYVAHHMSTVEGGMVCTDDADLADMLRLVRANGWDRNLSAPSQQRLRRQHGISSEFQAKYSFYDLSFNLRPTEITGFLGLHQLKLLDKNIRQREKNYQQFARAVARNPAFLPLERDHIRRLSSFCLPLVCRSTTGRDHYLARFQQAGVDVRPMIAGNIQQQPFYKKYINGRDQVELPGAEFLHHNSFYCGNYPELTAADRATIAACLQP